MPLRVAVATAPPDHPVQVRQLTATAVGCLDAGRSSGRVVVAPEENGEAHALLVKAVTDPDRQAANKALDELMGKLIVLYRLLEAEERLPRREPWTDAM